MAGYRNDQFFNFDQTGEPERRTTRVGSVPTTADNPPFIYPDRTVRTDDHTGHHLVTLKRGYIRSMARSLQGTPYPIKKCQFQFNPTMLSQQVHQTEGMLNFLQQDPGQYAQPMSGNVNFGFELQFDRSMEMNNASDLTAIRDPNTVNIWETGDPGQVGVFRDVAALYAVIGQGMSTDMRAYVVEAIQREASGKSQSTVTDTPITQASIDGKIGLLGDDNTPGFLSMNVGNIAFLLPVPVRVVFSSLYIVEGLISDSSVTFTKFNTSMVPMSCVVSVSMEAKYIGFAKKNTFLQWSLDNQVNSVATTAAADSAAANTLYSAFSAAGASMEFVVTRFWNENHSRTYPAEWPIDPNRILSYQSAGVTGLLAVQDAQSWLHLRLPSALGGQSNHSIQSTGGNTLAISNIYKSGATPSITLSGSITMYGPLTNPPATSGENATDSTQAILKTAASPLPKIYTVSANSKPAVDEQSWVEISSNAHLDVVDDHPELAARAPLASSPSSYYIMCYKGTMLVEHITDSGGLNLSGNGEVWELLGPGAEGHKFQKTISLTWAAPPDLARPGGNVPTVPPVTTTVPGTPSQVGAPHPGPGSSRNSLI